MNRALSLLVRFAALDQLTAPLRRMGQSSRAAGAEMLQTRQEVEKLQRATAKVNAFQQLQREIASSNTEMDQARRRVRELQAQMAQANGPTGRLAQQLAAAERQVTRLGTRTASQADRLRTLRTELTEAGVDVRDLAREQDRLSRSLGNANDRLEEQRRRAARAAAAAQRRERLSATGQSLQSAGGSAVASGGAMLAGMTVAVKPAVDFESAMADIRKVVDFDTPQQFTKMGDDILEMSKRLPMTAEGIAAIVAAGGSAKFPQDELLGFAEAATKMGVAFDMTAEDAGGKMASWRAAFGIGQKEVETLADKINQLGNTSGAKAIAISDIVTRIGPLGEVAGLANGEIAALGATLAAMGISEEIAATGIKNTMLALTKGEAATKAQAGAFKKLGLDAVKVSKSMQLDAKGTIIDVMERIAKLPKDAQAGLMTELFGSESVVRSPRC